MSQEYFSQDDSAGSTSQNRKGELHPNEFLRPSYMTVGQGSTSASATALMSSLDHDSGYGGSMDDGYRNDGYKRWNPAVTEDRYTPADSPGKHDVCLFTCPQASPSDNALPEIVNRSC